MFIFQKETAFAYYVSSKDFFYSVPLWTIFYGVYRYYKRFCLFDK